MEPSSDGGGYYGWTLRGAERFGMAPLGGCVSPGADTTRGGIRYTSFRQVVKTRLYVSITGCRWWGLLRGQPWATKSVVHQWHPRDLTSLPSRACWSTRADSLAVPRRRWLLFLLAKAAVTAAPTGGKARGICSTVSPRPWACHEPLARRWLMATSARNSCRCWTR